VAAVASSLTGVVVPPAYVLVGEVGLTGEIRSAPRIADRLREARQLGFTESLVPSPVDGYRVHTARTVVQALRALGLGHADP
jgi:DNA repair protein RadA/Sms